MIQEEHDLDGKVRGKVVCGDYACGRVLSKYEGSENSPGPDDSRYLLLRVQTRIAFVDADGNPVPEVPRWKARQLGADTVFSIGGRAIGYRFPPNPKTLLEDFCSDLCATRFLASSPDWGLCLRRQSVDVVLFVAQIPNRFGSEEVQVSNLT